MSSYYADKLNALSLFQVYASDIPRVRQYLEAEIDFVRKNLRGDEAVLELAAGYGRIMKELAPHCKSIVGMDISEENVALSKEYLKDYPNASMVVMDVHAMDFDQVFDVILCLQNGLSAMGADSAVIDKTLSLLAPGGSAYFSSYSAKFWEWRLKWFEEQAEKGLLGEIDYDKTKDGVIICKDGFRATTHSPEALDEIGKNSGLSYKVMEIDESSVFLIISKG
ncbi:class I SAM-dependent methyltransferase [Hominibacterium faecale]|uniref:class I SAM-dependent methyltransferase n=1 Tax=Hominibacterium faecale TaxID=2839743 RepID=UPI0022B2A945|nr:class I SAM-dependent methyltransferase [Hominibacterium faecale]